MSAPRIPTYYVGQRNPVLSDQITVNGAGVDLTTFTVQVKSRRLGTDDLKVNAAATTKDNQGNVTYALTAPDVDTAGYYALWWEATDAGGKVQHVLEALYEVREHGVPAGHLIDLHEARQFLELRSVNVESDDTLLSLIGAASDAIKNEYGRELAIPPATASPVQAEGVRTRDFALYGSNVMVDLAPYDLRVASEVRFDPDGANTLLVAGTDFMLSPVGGDDWGLYTELLISRISALTSDGFNRFGIGTVRITGTWGFAAVPEFVRQACKVTVRSWMRAGAANAVVEESSGRNLYPQAEPTYALPSAARRLLAPLRRNAGAL